MAKRYTVEFNAKITPIKPLNDEFTLCKCYVMALDKNRNLSFIGKDAADAALPTLYNIPVIGHLYEDDEGKMHMGGHDMTLVRDENGNLMFKSLCVPYGVVPQQDNVHYEDIREPNGDVHTYIVSDVILWTGRFPELYNAIYSDEIYFGQSMEINVDEYAPLEEDKNYTNIVKYTYSALCLLGKSDNPENHTEPCFPVSRVEPYEFSIDSQNDKFSELMTQFKEELSVCFESLTNDDAAQTSEISSEENSLTTIYQDADQDLEGALGEQGCVGHNGFSATYNTKREAIEQALPEEIELDEDNQPIVCVHYWLCDFDDKYAYVERNEWRRESGHTSKKGRFEYEFDEDNIVATISGEFVEVFVRWLTKEEVDVIEENREKYNELISYREDRERQDREAEFDKAIEEFEYLSEIEEFSNIYDNRYSYSSIDDLKDACYLIKGKYSITSIKAKQSPQEPILAIGDGDIAPATLHERFHQRFGKKKH